MELDGINALVTGAAHGIGRATALLLAERGAHVIAADIDEDGAKSVAQQCVAAGGRAIAIVVDVTSSPSVDAMVVAASGQVGRIHALAHVAGIYPASPMVEMTDETWDLVLDVNLTGTFRVCRAVGRHMLASGGGSIVNITSGAARIPYKNLSAYAASKGGVISFSRTIADELAPFVRVNVIGPGPTYVGDGPAPDNPLAALIPLGRFALPDEIAEGIVFLASDRARFVTGQVLHVNGGRSMH